MPLSPNFIPNPNLAELVSLDKDVLYHLGLNTDMDLQSMFHDVKYICMGGSPNRAVAFANKAAEELGIPQAGNTAYPIAKTERCNMCKVGPVLSISHGMGMPSLEIFLNEVTKLLHYAGATDVEYIRIGTSGGLLNDNENEDGDGSAEVIDDGTMGVGVKPGTVVIARKAINGYLKPEHETAILGKKRVRPTILDEQLSDDIMAARGDIEVVMGNTMGCDGFYEEQGRLDGALDPGYTEEDKMEFLRKAYREADVRNIEMESGKFASFCLQAGIPAAIVCTTLLDRLQGDQVTSTDEELAQFSDNAQTVVISYIRDQLVKKREAAAA